MKFEPGEIYLNVINNQCIKVESAQIVVDTWELEVRMIEPTTMEIMFHNFLTIPAGQLNQWEKVEIV